MNRLVIGAAAVLALACQPAHAQVQPGQRVRIIAPSAGFQSTSGVVVLELTPDSVRVERKGMQTTIARSSIVRLEVSDGHRSRATSAGIGALGGIALGLAVGWQYDKGAPVSGSGRDAVQEDRNGLPVFTAIGGLLGAAFGALRPSDRWREVASMNVTADVAPTRNGAAITLTRRF